MVCYRRNLVATHMNVYVETYRIKEKVMRISMEKTAIIWRLFSKRRPLTVRESKNDKIRRIPMPNRVLELVQPLRKESRDSGRRGSTVPREVQSRRIYLFGWGARPGCRRCASGREIFPRGPPHFMETKASHDNKTERDGEGTAPVFVPAPLLGNGAVLRIVEMAPFAWCGGRRSCGCASSAPTQ